MECRNKSEDDTKKYRGTGTLDPNFKYVFCTMLFMLTAFLLHYLLINKLQVVKGAAMETFIAQSLLSRGCLVTSKMISTVCVNNSTEMGVNVKTNLQILVQREKDK